jgi:hypothetical protein
MPKRKHITELALNFFSNGVLMLHSKDIRRIDQSPEDVLELANNCHIYLIATHPRVSFVPNSVIVRDGKTFGRFRYVRNGVPQSTEFWLHGEANADKIEISEYPHHKLSLIKNGERFFTAPAHTFCMMCDHVDDESIRDLEVVYVGMSYAEGTRSARDRLLSHSTLQQVLADLNGDSPDSEALIIMAQYDSPQTIISFDGRDKSLKLEDDRDVVDDLQMQHQKITKDLQIALIEAGLIRYFQPTYNDKYKERFPHPTHKILNEVYEIDFGALSVGLGTEELSCRLYSKTREAGYYHIGSVDLHDPKVRRSFFNFMNIDKGPDAANHSGPIY